MSPLAWCCLGDGAWSCAVVFRMRAAVSYGDRSYLAGATQLLRSMPVRALSKVAAAIGTAAVLTGWQGSALAITPFMFFYETGGGILTGDLLGHILGDGNSVEISAISNVLFNGTATFSPYEVALPFQDPGIIEPGLTSLNGSTQNFIACAPSLSECFDGFLFYIGEVGEAEYDNSNPFFYGPRGEYVVENWTLTQVAAKVPGPIPALGAPAAFGFSRKLRRRIARSKAVPVASAIE